MPLSITGCVVSRNNANVLTNPTSAELYDDLKASMHIIITGGNVATALVKDAAYKITGTVSGINRTFLQMKCKSTVSPYRFDK